MALILMPKADVLASLPLVRTGTEGEISGHGPQRRPTEAINVFEQITTAPMPVSDGEVLRAQQAPADTNMPDEIREVS
jgi:hypothetical protein